MLKYLDSYKEVVVTSAHKKNVVTLIMMYYSDMY